MGWSGSGSSAPPASAIDCLCNGISSYPCFLLTVLFGLTALPFVMALVWVVRDSRCSSGVLVLLWRRDVDTCQKIAAELLLSLSLPAFLLVWGGAWRLLVVLTASVAGGGVKIAGRAALWLPIPH